MSTLSVSFTPLFPLKRFLLEKLIIAQRSINFLLFEDPEVTFLYLQYPDTRILRQINPLVVLRPLWYKPERLGFQAR
jgi:hypothetical protein